MRDGIRCRSVYVASAGQAIGVVLLFVLYGDKCWVADLDDCDTDLAGGCELLRAGHVFLGGVRGAGSADGDIGLYVLGSKSSYRVLIAFVLNFLSYFRGG